MPNWDAWPIRELKAAIEKLYAAPREELIRFLSTEGSEYVSQTDARGLRYGKPIDVHGVRFFEEQFTRSGVASDILKLVPTIGREKILTALREAPTHS